MLRSRPVQYLGLALLVLACLGVIFFPVGAPPQPQNYTLTFQAAKPFNQLAPAPTKGQASKSASDLVDAALVTAFPSGQGALPSSPLTFAPGSKSATITDKAATREEARARAARIAGAVSKALPGATLVANEGAFSNLPVAPVFQTANYAVFPYQRDTAVKLGLDLRGGVNLVLQVRRALFPFRFDKKLTDADARDAFLSNVRNALKNAGQGLDRADVNFAAGSSDALEVRTQAKDSAEFEAQKSAIAAALRNVAGVKFSPNGDAKFYDPNQGSSTGIGVGASQASERLDRTVEIVRARVDKLGVSEPLIQKQLPDRIIVQLPGVNDPQKAVAAIGTTAQMEIRLLPANLVPIPQRDPTTGEENVAFYRLEGGRPTTPVSTSVARQQSELVVPGNDVKPTTKAVFDQSGQPVVSFELQGDSVKRFADVTRQVQNPDSQNQPEKNRYIPVFLDERCITAPSVNSAITSGEGQISGGFKTIEEAQALTSLLNSGALPAPIDVVENRTVSATLGQDSLTKSLVAGLIGLGAVALFMIFFYRLPGLLADFALVIYCLLNLAVFILLGGTLTLPGIAGFLLAIAMSLDTNILVFERLREEMAIQPTFTAALRAAFSRAWTAILDSHVTTLIAAVVLFFFGTGPVKGFALTLGVGVLLSLFSAISVTRLFMWSVASAGERNRNLFGSPVARSEVAAESSTRLASGSRAK